MARKLKILHTVESYLPAANGMSEVVRQLSERLVAAGHEVTVATGVVAGGRGGVDLRGVRVAEFDLCGNAVTGYRGDPDAYRRFLLEGSYDVVTNFAAQQWATDLALPLLPRIAGRKVFVPTGFSALFSKSFSEYYRKMPGYLGEYDMNVFLSDCYRDISFARRHGIARTTLIPNGAAADEFLATPSQLREKLGIGGEAFLVLHVGSHTWLKGHQEAMEIFRRADLCDATLLLVGNDSPGGCGASCRERARGLNRSAAFVKERKRIVVTELSRPETVAAYHAADLFLFPSNIECSPIVLFECMASRTPFLVTEVGNSAEIVGWSGGAGKLLPSHPPRFLPHHGSLRERLREKLRIVTGKRDDFQPVRAEVRGSAALLSELYRDPERRREMGSCGFSAWSRRFTWEKIALQYQALYLDLVEGRL